MAINRAVKIGTIEAISSKDYEVIPDDRMELVQTVTNSGTASVTVEDYGVVQNGEKISLTAVFSSADYATLVGIWSARTLVRVELSDGTVIQNARVVIKRTQYADELHQNYKKVQLEVWRI